MVKTALRANLPKENLVLHHKQLRNGPENAAKTELVVLGIVNTTYMFAPFDQQRDAVMYSSGGRHVRILCVSIGLSLDAHEYLAAPPCGVPAVNAAPPSPSLRRTEYLLCMNAGRYGRAAD